MVGFIGESYVIYKLGTLGLRSQKLLDFNDFDLLLENGLKVEIKTSVIRTRTDSRRSKQSSKKYWTFSNMKHSYAGSEGYKALRKVSKRFRNCDYFVFVGLDMNLKTEKCFVVPSNLIMDRAGITIPFEKTRDVKNSYYEYFEKWSFLTDNPCNTQEWAKLTKETL